MIASVPDAAFAMNAATEDITASSRAHAANTDRVVAGSNGPGGGQRMHWSADGGESWSQVDLPQGSTCCDPAVDWSSDGGYAYATALVLVLIFRPSGLLGERLGSEDRA